MRFGSGISVSAKEHLHAVIFCFRDERLVATLIPLAASAGILEPAEIERFGEDLVNRAVAKRLATHLPGGPGAKAPFIVGDFSNFWRGVETCQHQIPHAPDQWEAFRVFDQCVFSRLFVGVVQITGWGNTRIPAVLDLCFQSPLHVFAQIIHVFLGHAEFDIHEDDVVILVRVALGRCHDFDAVLFDGPDDRAAVNGVAGKAVQFPANDAGGLAPVEALHHGIEHRAPWLFGGFRFDQDFCHRQIEFCGNLLQFTGLRFNGKNLPVFGFG